MKFKNYMISKNKFKNKFIYFFDQLWSLNRSLTGNDTRKTHKILSKIFPLKTFEVKSGKKVNDWTVPNEWNVKSAYIANLKKKKIIDFKKNNLHVVGYSVPFNGFISKKKLLEKITYLKSLPNAIPYKTSYYKKDWGFCVSYNQLKKLKDKKFYVKVDTKLHKGSMTISEMYLPGKIKKEILIHAYTCHPSMAINELSGPLIASILAKEVSKIKNRYFSYRFIFAPETIGSISYLHINGKELIKNTVAGFVCNSLGYKNFISYKKSKKGNSIGDLAAIRVLKKTKKYKIKISKFYVNGSDERQYCSLGYNLPVGTLLSAPDHKYKEYHTSLDNKSILNFNNLYISLKIFLQIFKEIENLYKSNYLPKIKKVLKKNKNQIYPKILITKGEPRLSKYKVHYEMKKDNVTPDDLTFAIKWLVHYSDGFTSLSHISTLSKINILYIKKAYKILKEKKILK